MSVPSLPSALKWAFIGVGNMGGPLVLNLRKNLPTNHEVMILDREVPTAEKVKREAEGKVTIAPSMASVSESADVIMTCLPNPAIANEVFQNVASFGQRATPDRLVIDYSTIDSTTSKGIFARLKSVGFGTFVDAPMSGGVVGAQAATLTFMVGGTNETFARVKPILEMLGKRVVHCGEQGTGLTAKIANNYLLAINNLGTAEAMNFAIKAGLDPTKIAGILNSSTGRNWSSEINNPVPGVVAGAPASHQYQGGFATRLMNKDLNLAIQAAEQAQIPLPLSKSASRIYSQLTQDHHYAGLDLSVVYDYLRTDEKAKI